MAVQPHGGSVPPYGAAIRASIAEGNVAKMKTLCADVERQLTEHGDVRAALEVLKAEIAKAAAKGR